MNYFSLPLFYENYEFNHRLWSLTNEFPEAFRDELGPCCLEYHYGNFPYAFWNGDLNNNVYNSPIFLYDDMSKFNLNNHIPLIFDMSNIFLNENDIYNAHLNAVLDIFKMNGNLIKLSNFSLLTYIKENYKGYRFILAKNCEYPDFINEVMEDGVFTLYELPGYWNEEQYKNIKYKSKCIITLGDKCPCNCSSEVIQNCRQQENLFQINFSEKSHIEKCDKFYPLNFYNEFEHLKKLGFNRFQFATPNSQNINLFNKNVIKFLIKPEYHLEVIS